MTQTSTTPRRTDLPVMLPGATRFSDDRDVLTPLAVVQLVKQHPEILDDLVAATTFRHEGRKERLPGYWALAMLAFVCSGFIDIEPWWTQTADTNLWEECGFDRRPSYQATRDRFVELEMEGCEIAFRQAAWKLIRRARKHTNGLVGRDIHVDSTEAETNSRFVHDCEPGKCPNATSVGSAPRHPSASRLQPRGLFGKRMRRRRRRRIWTGWCSARPRAT